MVKVHTDHVSTLDNQVKTQNPNPTTNIYKSVDYQTSDKYHF